MTRTGPWGTRVSRYVRGPEGVREASGVPEAGGRGLSCTNGCLKSWGLTGALEDEGWDLGRSGWRSRQEGPPGREGSTCTA